MLILKSTVKDIFTKAGLEDFTVGRDNAGYLNIVGPCGKSLVSITNFSIGSKLTKAERDICINEHIIPVLDAHKATIIDLIKDKEDEVKTKATFDAYAESEEKKGYRVTFRLTSDYGIVDIVKKNYYGNVCFGLEDEENYLDIGYSSKTNKTNILMKAKSASDAPGCIKLLKSCDKVYNKAKILFEKYVDAEYKTKVSEDKLRVECSI
jgi:hypothetical protein